MFRLFRLTLLMGIAFVAGFLYAESGWQERCIARGGEAREGLCFGELP